MRKPTWSAPTTSLGHTAKTQPCDDGVSAWVPAAEGMREGEPWWPSPGSLQFCSIGSGSHRRFTCRSTKQRPERRSTVATTPTPDDCARGWALNEADRKLAASLSPTGPQPAQSQRLTHSAYRNTVEKQHASQPTTEANTL